MNYSEIIINGSPVKLIPLGDCACGCGGKTNICQNTNTKRKRVAGNPYKYLWGHNSFARCGHKPSMLGRTREKNPAWKGGRSADSMGYMRLYMPEYHKADSVGYVREHIYLAEKALGKPLPNEAEIHHANGNKSDNHTPFNIIICQDKKYHSLLEQRARAYYACGHANWRKCMFCKEYDDPINLYITCRNQGYHRSCRNERVHIKRLAKKPL